MNNIKPTRQPSPSNSRKPFTNLTNLTNINSYNSVDSKPKQPLQILTRFGSTKFLPSPSRGDTPVDRIRSRKNGSLKIKKHPSQFKVQEFPSCANHKNRQGKHTIKMKSSTQLYCLECCFYYAKQGYKVNLLQQSRRKEDRMISETKNYLHKCEDVKGQVKVWLHDFEQVLKEMKKLKEDTLSLEKAKMERQIQKIREQHHRQKQKIETQFHKKQEYLMEIREHVEGCHKLILNTEVDIQNNIEIITTNVEEEQFRLIMDKYWNKINQIAEYLHQNESEILLRESVTVQILSTEGNKGPKCSDEFTFSKKERIQTPPSNRLFDKIRIVNSEGQTLNNSSMKDSVVDMKLNFQ